MSKRIVCGVVVGLGLAAGFAVPAAAAPASSGYPVPPPCPIRPAISVTNNDVRVEVACNVVVVPVALPRSASV